MFSLSVTRNAIVNSLKSKLHVRNNIRLLSKEIDDVFQTTNKISPNVNSPLSPETGCEETEDNVFDSGKAFDGKGFMFDEDAVRSPLKRVDEFASPLDRIEACVSPLDKTDQFGAGDDLEKNQLLMFMKEFGDRRMDLFPGAPMPDLDSEFDEFRSEKDYYDPEVNEAEEDDEEVIPLEEP